MIIGYMRNFKEPRFMAKFTAKMCKHHGLELLYLRPQDVNIKQNTVKGKMLINDKWLKVESPLPQFIDVSLYCYKKKNREKMDYLRENTFLSDNNKNRIGKQRLQEFLMKDERFIHLTIPSHRVQDKFEELENFLRKHSTIVIKPLKGERGKGIYILSDRKNDFLLGHNKEQKVLSHDELRCFFNESIRNKRYISQKYI